MTFRWYFKIDGSQSNDLNIGRFQTWNSPKTLALHTRAYGSNDVERFYGVHYWNASSSGVSSIVRQPQIEIIAYGNPAV